LFLGLSLFSRVPTGPGFQPVSLEEMSLDFSTLTESLTASRAAFFAGVGNVGTDFRDQFTALGPHVNFASRIEARSQSGQILLSQSTEARVRAVIEAEAAGEISDIKNISGTFKLFSAKADRTA
jgi:hypothetical protein